MLKKDAIREQLRELLIEEAEKQASIEAEQSREAMAKELEEEESAEVEVTPDSSLRADESESLKSRKDDLPPSYNEIVSCEQTSDQKMQFENSYENYLLKRLRSKPVLKQNKVEKQWRKSWRKKKVLKWRLPLIPV